MTRAKEFIPDCKDCQEDGWTQMLFILRKARREAWIAAMRNHHRLGHVNEFANCGFTECVRIYRKLGQVGKELRA